MFTLDTRIELEVQIGEWLKTSPADAEVRQYVERLTDPEALEIAENEAVDFLEQLRTAKDEYFISINCQEILKTLDESDQLLFILNCTDYNAPSVLRKLTTEHPKLIPLALPPNFSQWAGQYIGQFNAAIALLAGDEFIKTRLYMGSLQRTSDRATLEALYEGLKVLYLKEGEAYDAQRALSQADIDDWQTYFRALKFLPEEQCNALAQHNSYITRQSLIEHLMMAFAILLNAPDGSDYQAELWDILRQRTAANALGTSEGSRKFIYSDTSALKNGLKALYDIWTEQNIMTGNAAAQTAQVLHTLEFEGNPVDIVKFLGDNFVLEYLCEPVKPYVIIDNIEHAPNRAEAEVYISQLLSTEAYADKKELMQKLLHQLLAVIRPQS